MAITKHVPCTLYLFWYSIHQLQSVKKAIQYSLSFDTWQVRITYLSCSNIAYTCCFYLAICPSCTNWSQNFHLFFCSMWIYSSTNFQIFLVHALNERDLKEKRYKSKGEMTTLSVWDCVIFLNSFFFFFLG